MNMNNLKLTINMQITSEAISSIIQELQVGQSFIYDGRKYKAVRAQFNHNRPNYITDYTLYLGSYNTEVEIEVVRDDQLDYKESIFDPKLHECKSLP